MKHMKLFSLITAAAMLLGAVAALASCSDSKPSGSETGTLPADSSGVAAVTTETPVTTEPLVTLEVKDLDNTEIVMLWPTPLTTEGHFINNELAGDGADPSDIINWTVYQRTKDVEEAYNVRITVVEQKFSTIPSTVKNEYNTNSSSYGALATVIASMSPIALEGALADFRELPYCGEETTWWNHDLMKKLAVANRQYFGSGDIIYSDDLYPYVVYANTGLADTLQIRDNFYDLVAKKEWTLDKFHELAVIAAADLDGDGVKSNSLFDRFGAVDGTSFARAIYYSAGKGVISLDSEGYPSLEMTAEHADTVLTKIVSVFHNDTAVVDAETKFGVNTAMGIINMFCQDQMLFMPGDLKAAQAFSGLSNALPDFALLPIPLWNSDSEYVCVMNDAVVISVPAMAENIEDAALILSAMSRASVDTLTPAFFDMILAYRYMTNAQSVSTLKLILNSVVPRDVADIQGWGGLMSSFSRFAVEGNTEFQSTYASCVRTLNSTMRTYKAQLSKIN